MQRFARVAIVSLALVLSLDVSPDTAAAARGWTLRRASSGEHTLAIVINRSNPVDNLSFDRLRKIFLGERSHWPNGRRIAVLMMARGRPERQAVLREIYHMSEERYRDHFLRGLFTRDVLVSPKTLASPAVVRKFLLDAPGAIGYLRASDVDESVKVVRIDGLLPSDTDYLLQIDELLTD